MKPLFVKELRSFPHPEMTLAEGILDIVGICPDGPPIGQQGHAGNAAPERRPEALREQPGWQQHQRQAYSGYEIGDPPVRLALKFARPMLDRISLTGSRDSGRTAGCSFGLAQQNRSPRRVPYRRP